MKLEQLLEFKKELYFEGAVQADWFYNPDKAKKVAENFVFHGKKYYGIDNSIGNKRIDTISFVKMIGEKLSDENFNPLSLAIADYGTGKSHLSVTLAQLLSGPSYMKETFDKIIENISKIDKSEAKIISKYYSRRNLVLVINGMKDFNLHSELLKAAQKTLLLYGISDEKLRKINRSLEIAEMFLDRNFELFHNSFENVAKTYDWFETDNKLYLKLKENLLNDDISFEIINKVYSEINGHIIHWDEGLSATAILEELVRDYCGSDGKFDSVVILFDEFGRYLEYASGTDSGKSGDSALQQMFEASQNLEGKLQIVNFIQSDIKTYLQRVDNTKNISRYIGRYDISDKYYISSNLETVFANLIHRKDEKDFNRIIVSKQNELEDNWKTIYAALNRWSTTNGIWSEYSLFRNVIVEGIYPMHPISTFMLSQLSDYLQNRSSLTLISSYINEKANIEIGESYFCIYPEELLKGDLFVEILSSEQEGKQSSQHCIKYYNVLRKYEDKLGEDDLKVLRANLALRILRFRTESLDDVLLGLKICSGLDYSTIKSSLDFLENEYGILGYDDRACCFDFMEESNGAHDYKIIKKRLLANAKFDPYLLRNNLEILKLTGNDTNIDTNFGVLNRITSIEWQFEQQLYAAEDINESLIDNYINNWKLAVTPDKTKGQLMWVYISRDTNLETINLISMLSKKVSNFPIVLMALNDSNNRLKSDLIEYTVLKSMDQEIKNKYDRHYFDDVNQNKERIKFEFDNLKRERLYFTNDGIISFDNRITKELSKLFSKIYPNVISFNYDGLITAKKNIAPKSNKNFFQIIQMILCGNINEDSIHNQPIEIRNRIEALLYQKFNGSWKCMNEECHLVPPEDEKVRNIYDLIINYLDENDEVNIKDIYDCLTLPPYGLNTYSFILLVAIILANLDYCTRIKLEEHVYNLKSWRDLIFIKEGKIEFNEVLKSQIIKVDVGEIEDKFLNLFKTIENNKDVNQVKRLNEKLTVLLEENEIPDRLTDALKLAQKTLRDGDNAKKEWIKLGIELSKLNEEMSESNIYPGLKALQKIEETDVENIFTKYKYQLMDFDKNQLFSLKDDIENYIFENFNLYLNSLRCNEVERLIQFRNHSFKMEKQLRELNFQNLANKLSDHVNQEIKNIERIKEKQNFKNDCENFIKKCHVDKYTTLVQLKEYDKEVSRLLKLYQNYSIHLGKEANSIKNKLDNKKNLILKEKSNIINSIGTLYDDLYEVSSYYELGSLIEKSEELIKRGLPDQDYEAVKELNKDLTDLKLQLDKVTACLEDRKLFNEESKTILAIYQYKESDISVEMVEKILKDLENVIDEKEQLWLKRFSKFDEDDIKDIYRWIESTKNVPLYLSEKTLDMHQKNLIKAKEIISSNRIRSALYYYELLSKEEKQIFIEKISKQ